MPIYVRGSTLFGAQLAAMLGLPYAYAAVNVISAPLAADAEHQRFTAADELMTVRQGGVVDDRILSLTLTAKAMGLG